MWPFLQSGEGGETLAFSMNYDDPLSYGNLNPRSTSRSTIF